VDEVTEEKERSLDEVKANSSTLRKEKGKAGGLSEPDDAFYALSESRPVRPTHGRRTPMKTTAFFKEGGYPGDWERPFFQVSAFSLKAGEIRLW